MCLVAAWVPFSVIRFRSYLERIYVCTLAAFCESYGSSSEKCYTRFKALASTQVGTSCIGTSASKSIQSAMIENLAPVWLRECSRYYRRSISSLSLELKLTAKSIVS